MSKYQSFSCCETPNRPAVTFSSGVFLFGVRFLVRAGAGTLGEGSRGERDEEGHGGDEDLFHRFRVLVDSYEDSHFSGKAAARPFVFCVKNRIFE